MVKTPMVKYLLALTLLISGCASVPKFSSDPQDCNPATWGDEYPHDLVNYAKAIGRTFERAMPYICVDEAEVIRLPSFLQLLDLPPACLLYTSPSPRDRTRSRMPSSA